MKHCFDNSVRNGSFSAPGRRRDSARSGAPGRHRGLAAIAALLLIFPEGARAQDTFSLWSYLTFNTNVGERCYATLRIEDRTDDLTMIRPIFGVRITPWLKTDIALDQIWKHNGSPAFQQILLSCTGTLKSGQLSASVRERYICSFKPMGDDFTIDPPGIYGPAESPASSAPTGYYSIGDGDYFTIGHILRSKLTVSYTADDGVCKPYLAVEVFSWDRWQKTRYYVGSDFKVSDQCTLSPFYMYLTFADKSYGQHTLGFGLQYKF